MHPKAYIKNYLWNCVVAYHNLNYEEYERAFLSSTATYQRPTSKHWDIVHQCHYYVSKFWKLTPENELEDTAKMFSQSGWRNHHGQFKYTYHPWSPWYRSSRSNTRWHRRWYRGYREERTKYQRRPHHTKKVLSEHEEHKKAWRLKKKGKKHKPNYSRRRSCPKHWKKIGNGRHRQWEKAMIDSGDWDALSNQRKYKETVSPWDWD